MLCVMLVGSVGTVAAVHTHGKLLPSNATRFTTPADVSQGQGEENCPLCVAMHSTLPITMQVVPEPVQDAGQLFTLHVPVTPQKLWIFAMFSRPPPVAARMLAVSSAS